MTNPLTNPADETERRLAGLAAGPWVQNATRAFDFLRPPKWIPQGLSVQVPIAAPRKIRRSDADRLRRIEQCLSAHPSDSPRSPKRAAVRASLNEALEYLQLLELAIETGYISTDAARPVATDWIRQLLWSKAAWKFVADQKQLAVVFLAARLGSIRTLMPPAPSTEAAVRFAGFLSAHETFRDSSAIDEWVAFLDQNGEDKRELESFRAFLLSDLRSHAQLLIRPSGQTKRFHRLLTGLVDFSVQVSRAFRILEPTELPRFGILHSYRLARFFGCRSKGTGFVKDPMSQKGSWAACALKAPILRIRNHGPVNATDGLETEWESRLSTSDAALLDECAIEDSLRHLEYAWRLTREFVSEHEEVLRAVSKPAETRRSGQEMYIPRRPRLHVPGGVYYVILRTIPGQHVFAESSDYDAFERFLADALRRCRTFIHAFRFQRGAVHLVVQITDVPLGRFIQRLTSQYARYVHKKRGGAGSLFQKRHHALLIDPETYLLRLIRHLHQMPDEEGAIEGTSSDRLSSHSAYLGIKQVPWLTRRLGLRMLVKQGMRPDTAYAHWMREVKDPRDVMLFTRGSRRDPRVRGYAPAFAALRKPEGASRQRAPLDEIIDRVAIQMGVERDAVLSPSRKRELVIARALVTWHAIEGGVATLAEVARRVRRDPSTLFVGVKRFRVLRPDLFDRSFLHEGDERAGRHARGTRSKKGGQDS